MNLFTTTQVKALHSQQLSAALKELTLATGSDRSTTTTPVSAPSPTDTVPFAAKARAVQASGVTAFRRAFAEDLALEGETVLLLALCVLCACTH